MAERPATWSALLAYPGLRAFHFGTVVATATHAEGELRALWAETFPGPMPELVELLPGAVVFQGRKEC